MMNKLIEKLKEQAEIKFEAHPQHMGIDTAVITPVDLEKFAELIVKECAQVAFEGDLKRAIGQWGSHSDILIHFGIEHDVVKKFRGEE